MKILAFSGRMQSGKNTSFNYLLGIELLKLGVVRNTVKITNEGKLEVSDIFGDKSFSGIFDIDRPTRSMRDFRSEYIYPFIRNFSFADELKSFCIKTLGLTYEQCYGSQEQKDSLTHLRWENCPNNTDGKTGLMSGREVMEHFGSNVCRQFDDNCWARACINSIKDNQSHLAIITDCRFPNEVDAIHQIGGKIIRLDRTVNNKNSKAERALDRDMFDWSKFDRVIENSKLTIGQTNEQIYRTLLEWNFIDEIQEE